MKRPRRKLIIGAILLLIFSFIFGTLVFFTNIFIASLRSMQTQATKMSGSMQSVENALDLYSTVGASVFTTEMEKADIIAAAYVGQKKEADMKPEYFRDGAIVKVSDGQVEYPAGFPESVKNGADDFPDDAGIQYCYAESGDDNTVQISYVVFFVHLKGPYYYIEWVKYADIEKHRSQLFDIDNSFASFENAFQERFLVISDAKDDNGEHLLIYRSDELPAYNTAEAFGITQQMLSAAQESTDVPKSGMIPGTEAELENAEMPQSGLVPDTEAVQESAAAQEVNNPSGTEADSGYNDSVISIANTYTILTIDGTVYELYLKRMGDSAGWNSTILAYLVPFSGASSSAVEQIGIITAVYIIIGIVFLVWFYSMMCLVRDHSLNKKQHEEFRPRSAVRMSFSIIGIGAVVIFGIVALTMSLFRLYSVCSQVDTSLTSLEQRIKGNESSKKLAQDLKKKYYEEFAALTAELMQEYPDFAHPDNLQKICDATGAEYIMLFDNNGDETATNSRYVGISLGTEESSSTYDFRRLLNGVPLITHDLAKDEITGEKNVMIGVSYGVPSGGAGYNALLMAVPGNKIYNSAVETSSDIMSSLVTKGTHAFSVDPETKVIKDASERALVGRDSGDLGLPEQALHNGWRDFFTFNGELCYGECEEINGILYYYVSVRSRIYEYVIECSVVIVIGYLILMSILALYMLFGYKAFFAEWSEVGAELKSDVNEVEISEGRRKFSRDPGIRWKPGSQRYGALAPIHNAFTTLKVLLVICILLIALRVIQSNEAESSLVGYILGGQWTKGFNLFALTAILVLFAEVVIAVMLAKLILRLISQALGTKGDTVCRLLINLTDYVGIICFVYFALYDLGFRPNTLLASLGLMSFAISLGAKDLITDIIAGLSIVFEGTYQVGDIIEVAGYRGEVLEIGVRTTKLEGRGGNIKIIGNRDIKNVVNMTRKNSWYALDVSVPSDMPLNKIEEILEEQLPKIGESMPEILSGPYYKGVVAMGRGSATLSIIAECNEADYFVVGRAINRAVTEILEKNGIKIM